MPDKSRNLESFYLEDYERVMSSGLVGMLWKYIHRLMDKPLHKMNRPRIIELGSGSSQHFNLTKLESSEYLEIDIREDINRSLDLEKVKSHNYKFQLGDATTLTDIKDKSYDVLIATCLFAHLQELEKAINNWNRVISKQGMLVIYVPCEPGFVLRIARSISTKRKFQRAGYDHSYIHYREHRNHYPLMKSVIVNAFPDDLVRIKRFPFNFLPWDFNLFSLFIIQKTT